MNIAAAICLKARRQLKLTMMTQVLSFRRIFSMWLYYVS